MKYKNIDILISQRMATVIPMNRIMYRDRISDTEGIDLTLDAVIKIIKTEIRTLKLYSNDIFPAQIHDAIAAFMSKQESEMNLRYVNMFIALFRYYGFDFEIIGRVDINSEVIEMKPVVDQLAYLTSSTVDNQAECLAVSTGYAIGYEFGIDPLCMDFLSTVFTLSPEEKSTFDLTNSFTSYKILSDSDNLRKFDDTYAREFASCMGYKFVIYQGL